MTIDVRHYQVKVLPLDGKLHASIRCKKCRHKKNILEPISAEIIKKWENKGYCSKCKSKNFSIDVFTLAKVSSFQAPSTRKKLCLVCKNEISDETLFALPHTLCCGDHLDHNPAVIPKLDEPLGTREDFKKDSRSNWARSRSNKL